MESCLHNGNLVLQFIQEKKKVPLYRGPAATLAIPAFQARTQTALFEANNKQSEKTFTMSNLQKKCKND